MSPVSCVSKLETCCIEIGHEVGFETFSLVTSACYNFRLALYFCVIDGAVT